jgi:recombination protein RecT
MSTAITKQSDSGVRTVAQYLNADNTKKYLESVLKERAGQFITSLVSLSNLTPGIAKCEPKTLMYCGLKAASLNLPLDNNLGFAYAVPYGDKAQFQLGYKGYIQLAQNTGKYRMINVLEVKAGELKKWDPFAETLELQVIEDVEKREIAPAIGYAGMFELLNGFKKVVYWPRSKVEKHGRRFSKTFANGPWKTDFDQMAKKTVIKDLISKWGPMDTNLREAIKFDNAVIQKDDATGEEMPEYVDVQFEVDTYEAPQNNLADEFKEHIEKGGIEQPGIFAEGAGKDASTKQK